MDCFWILGVIASFTSVFGPKWWLWISILSSFILGFIFSSEMKGGDWLSGIIFGLIIASVFGIRGYSTRYFRSKALSNRNKLNSESIWMINPPIVNKEKEDT